MRRDRDRQRAEETQRIDMRMHEQSAYEEQDELQAEARQLAVPPRQDNVTQAGQQGDIARR